MPPKVLSYLGGINPDTTLSSLPTNQLVSGKNLLFKGGGLINRGGPFALVDPGGTGASKYISSLFYWNDSVNTKEWFIMQGRDSGNNVKLYQMLNDGSTSSATDITAAFTISGFARFDSLNGILIIQPPDGPQYQWTGSGNIAALGASWTSLNKNGIDIKVVNNFLFMASGSTVYWSNVGDPTTYTSGNSATFRPSDGDTIVGLSYIGTDLIIFKRRSIGRLSTTSQVISGAATLGPLTTLSVGVGGLCASAIDKLPDGRIVFLGSDGHVYLYDGSIPVDISQQAYPGPSIQSLLMTPLNRVGGAVGSWVISVVEPRQEIWVIPSGIFGDDYFIYNYQLNAWTQKPSTGTTNGAIMSAFSATSQFLSNSTGFKTVKSTSTGVFNTLSALITGDSGGHVWIEDCGTRVDQSGAYALTQIEFSVPVPADSRPSIQRFFTLPLKTGSAITITYYVGINGTYGSSQTFTSTGNWDRLMIPLKVSGSMVSQQVKVTCLASTTIEFEAAYISSEGDE